MPLLGGHQVKSLSRKGFGNLDIQGNKRCTRIGLTAARHTAGCISAIILLAEVRCPLRALAAGGSRAGRAWGSGGRRGHLPSGRPRGDRKSRPPLPRAVGRSRRIEAAIWLLSALRAQGFWVLMMLRAFHMPYSSPWDTTPRPYYSQTQAHWKGASFSLHGTQDKEGVIVA